jgi:hypothetical protein
MMGRGKIVEGSQLVGTGMGKKVGEDVSWNKSGENGGRLSGGKWTEKSY